MFAEKLESDSKQGIPFVFEKKTGVLYGECCVVGAVWWVLHDGYYVVGAAWWVLHGGCCVVGAA